MTWGRWDTSSGKESLLNKFWLYQKMRKYQQLNAWNRRWHSLNTSGSRRANAGGNTQMKIMIQFGNKEVFTLTGGLTDEI